MCRPAHAWVGLGRIVYATSAAQLTQWRRGWGVDPAGPVAVLAITDVAPGISVSGPDPDLEVDVHALQARFMGVSPEG